MKGFRQFRAWHKELKIMLYPPNTFDSMTDCRDSAGNHRKIKIERVDLAINENVVEEHNLYAHMTWDGRWYIAGKYQDVEWMQYTGLKVGPQYNDGKKIFEGDLLLYKGKLWAVEYWEDYAGYMLVRRLYGFGENANIKLDCDVAFESEHKGNIYENENLLIK